MLAEAIATATNVVLQAKSARSSRARTELGTRALSSQTDAPPLSAISW
jgi:hypothetical protein